ncbi:hypothetical protein [Deinococcus sonorensis]|uniref:Uncharacterized protein n=1 Tax=Deinococcus sonorensis TaxID=309891 RepID=A0ABV8YCK2_9DEIO
MALLHELWEEGDEGYTFCLAGPHGDDARRRLSPDARLIWTVEAGSHFEAMTSYYEYMDWGPYRSDQPWDRTPYPEAWTGPGVEK